MGSLNGKVAIITGSGHGLGRSHALLFAKEGAKGIVINDIGVGIQDAEGPSSETAEETVRQLKEIGCDAEAVFGDCSEMSTGKNLVDTALERWGKLDILVNNAGILRDRMIFNMEEDDWDSVIRVHLKGHFATTKYATWYWRQEVKAGRPVAGRIVNTSSAAGLFGNAGQPNYAAAKAGIVGLTLALAFSMARYGVTANVIGPGAETNPSVDIDGASKKLRDTMTPEHVSPLVGFLASDLAAEITGRIFHVVGGRIDHVTQHELVPGIFKKGTPWSIEEIAEAFGKLSGGNPEPVQEVLRILEDGVV